MPSLAFDKAMAEALCEQSRVSSRRRAHFSLHSSDAEPVHRLFVAMQPDSYVQPHRHLDPCKSETLIVLSGALGFLEFNAAGEVIAQSVLGPDGSGWGIDIPAGIWHCVVALKPDTLFFETKAGPYLALTDNERAPWAATEGSTTAKAENIRLRHLFSA